MTHPAIRLQEPIEVDRWPTERTLFIVALVVSLIVWTVLIVTIVGLVYAVMFGVFFAVMHLAFIAYVRGSAVQLGPEQFPELHAHVERLARRMGLDPVPEVYLMQAGGALNALATRFLRRHIVVLFSDLLDACGDNTAARDMIIAHELGHIRAGHLRFHWLLLPASVIPFLGQALSRAREYTCDRYGLAGAGDMNGALLGLTILAAGGKHAPRVNQRAFVAQRVQLNTGLMTLGEWLSTHPPLAKRLLALDPSLAGGVTLRSTGALRAAAVLALIFGPLMLGGFAAATAMPEWLERMKAAGAQANAAPGTIGSDSAAAAVVETQLDALGQFLEARQREGKPLPANAAKLYMLYQVETQTDAPLDPYDGTRYGYQRKADGFVLWSAGPDGESGTYDDIEWRPGEGITRGD